MYEKLDDRLTTDDRQTDSDTHCQIALGCRVGHILCKQPFTFDTILLCTAETILNHVQKLSYTVPVQ